MFYYNILFSVPVTYWQHYVVPVEHLLSKQEIKVDLKYTLLTKGLTQFYCLNVEF